MQKAIFRGLIVSVMVIILIIMSSILMADPSEVYLSLTRLAITPTRYEKEILLLPNSVSVVTKEDIKMSNTKQTTEILGELPGLFIRKTGDFGRADVDIRGIGGNGRQIGVFIDGRPDKMGVFGCAVTHTLPLNNVEKIEVIRGPESVLYGSDAFGGVINIITHRAQKKMEGYFTTSMGTYNTQNYRLQQGSKLDKLDYLISIDKRSSNGHKENSAYDSRDFSGQIGYALPDNSDISFSGKYFSGTKNEPAPSPAGTWNNYDRGSADLTYTKKAGDFDSSVKVYRTFGEHTFFDGFHSKDYTNGAMLHGKTNIGTDNKLSAGVDYRYQFGDILNTSPAKFIGQYHKYEYGVYVNDEHTFLEKIIVSGGARYNYDELAKSNVTPKIGLVYNIIEGTILRGIWSKGFRAPQINDLYLWGGNTELKPEKITNTEAGMRQRIGQAIDVDISVFSMKGKDLIQSVSGKNLNVGDFKFSGIETMLNARFTDSLNGQVNYTCFDPGTQTTGRPKDKIGASLNYAQGKLSGTFTGQYISRYYSADNSTGRIDDYLIFNTKGDYRILSNLSIFAAIDNLTNKEYQVYSSGLYTMPKRTFYLGLNYIFG